MIARALLFNTTPGNSQRPTREITQFCRSCILRVSGIWNQFLTDVFLFLPNLRYLKNHIKRLKLPTHRGHHDEAVLGFCTRGARYDKKNTHIKCQLWMTVYYWNPYWSKKEKLFPVYEICCFHNIKAFRKVFLVLRINIFYTNGRWPRRNLKNKITWTRYSLIGQNQDIKIYL